MEKDDPVLLEFIIQAQQQVIHEQNRKLVQAALDALIVISLLRAEQYKAKASAAFNRAGAGVGILVLMLL